MSIDSKRWAQRAQDLKFEQLPAIRRQAEGWRTGLTALTALLGSVLIVKGPDTVSGLAPDDRRTVVFLLGLALAGLVAATLLSIRAAYGEPGAEILLTGEDLQAWTQRQVGAAGRLLFRATVLTVVAVFLLASALGIAWLAPAAKPAVPLVQVISRTGQSCGELLATTGGNLVLKDHGVQFIPLTEVLAITPASRC